MSALLLLLFAMLPSAQVTSVRVDRQTEGTRVLVETSVAVTPGLSREEAGFVLEVPAQAIPGLELPVAAPPVKEYRLEQDESGVRLHIAVGPKVTAALRQDGAHLTVVLQGGPTPVASAPPPVADLYAKLFPAPIAEPEPDAPATQVRADEPGYPIGPARVQPSVSAAYVDAQTTLGPTPEPVRDRFFELQPQVDARLPLSFTRLAVLYAPVFRWGGQYHVTNSTTHRLEASATSDLGPAVVVVAGVRHVSGVLETAEVDPGHEYFFGLAPFSHTSLSANAHYKAGGRVELSGGATFDDVNVDAGGSFFDHERRELSAVAGYEINPRLTAGVRYAFRQVPRPEERPVAETSGHDLGLTLEGDVGPTLHASARFGYLSLHAPLAPPEARDYGQMSGGFSLRKELTPSTRVELTGGREVYPSRFESNPYYTASGGEAQATTALAFGLSLQGAAGYHWNTYRVPADAIGEPRRDRLAGWTLGMSYPLGRWGFARADYHRDWRHSNIPAYTLATHSFSLMLGLTPLHGGDVR
jgi:hypothetical protein